MIILKLNVEPISLVSVYIVLLNGAGWRLYICYMGSNGYYRIGRKYEVLWMFRRICKAASAAKLIFKKRRNILIFRMARHAWTATMSIGNQGWWALSCSKWRVRCTAKIMEEAWICQSWVESSREQTFTTGESSKKDEVGLNFGTYEKHFKGI